jgi:tetratricopeptide (TPR) repeat protein
MKRPRHRRAGKPEGAEARDTLKRLAESPAETRVGFSSTIPNRTWLLALLLVVGTILAYLPAWHARLIWDDRGFIMDNPLIRRADGLWRFWFSTKPVDYYPVTSTMWWIEWRLWGGNPMGYHGVNVLLHALGVVLLWRLLARLKFPGSWSAAAIFAVHPVNVESVAWIAERKNVLAMVFYLASLSCFVRSDSSTMLAGASWPSSGISSWRWYGLALAAFLLALLSKTVVAPMPFVLLGLVWWQRGRVKRADVLRVLPFLAMSAFVGSISFWFQSHRAIGADIVRTDSFWARLAGAGWAIWFYAYKALLPFGLRSIYPRWQIDGRAWWSYLPGLLVASVFVLCWRTRRTWGKAPLLASFYFVVMLSPVLGFLNIGFMKFSLVADHWQYFAIIGPIALLAAAIAKGYERLGPYPRRALVATVGAMLVGLAVLTYRQSELYRDSGTFWRAVLATDADAWGAHNNLGGFLVEQGQSDEALAHFRRAVELQPGFAKAQYNLGAALREKGQSDEAIVHLQRAVEIEPHYVEARNSLARALGQEGEWDRAMEHLERSLEIDPDQAEAHNNLANVLWQKGRLRQAAAEYEKALALHPDYAAAHFNLGEVLREEGETREAIAHYRRALEIRPDFAPALDSLAWALATSPDVSMRDGVQSVALATRAEQISGGRNPGFAATLAAAYAEVGRFPEAVATAERALRLATAQGKAALAARLRTQVALYQTGAPYREAGAHSDKRQ